MPPEEGRRCQNRNWRRRRRWKKPEILTGGPVGLLKRRCHEYYCPECNVELFHNEALAEAFLLGRKARPILLEKKRAKPVEGAK